MHFHFLTHDLQKKCINKSRMKLQFSSEIWAGVNGNIYQKRARTLSKCRNSSLLLFFIYKVAYATLHMGHTCMFTGIVVVVNKSVHDRKKDKLSILIMCTKTKLLYLHNHSGVFYLSLDKSQLVITLGIFYYWEICCFNRVK